MNFGEDKEQSLKNLQILYERFVFFFMHELTEIWLAASIVPLSEKAGPRDLAKSALYKISSLQLIQAKKLLSHPTAYCKKHCSVTFNWVVTLQGAKKVIFKACHSGKLKLACTSPNVISTIATKTFWWAELIAQFFCNLNSSKTSTCPLGKLRTKFASPIAKSTSPRLLATTFFACCTFM